MQSPSELADTPRLDPEVASRLSRLGSRLLRCDPLELMRRVRMPQHLFSYRKLQTCFAQVIVPTQLLTHDEGRPLVASPEDLVYLGPP